MQVQIVIHGGLIIHSTSFKAENKTAAETTARAKKAKASLEELRLPYQFLWIYQARCYSFASHRARLSPETSRPGILSASPIQSIKSKSLPQAQTGDRARKAASDWLGFPASVSWRAFPGRVVGDSEHPIQRRDASSCFARIVSSTTNT